MSGCLWSAFLSDARAQKTTTPPVPYMDIHGDSDVQVGTWDNIFTYTYLRSLGVAPADNRLVIVPGGGHVPWGAAEKERLRPVVMGFLAQALRLEELTCGGT